ncbi:hypothetical protein R1flu_019016 [Riccia fluitans]|uniref:Uncharacterized protein n=1 Tax=Riccia fluitans TaxID=41844 RepID=A0ABD1ZHH6_9MARC
MTEKALVVHGIQPEGFLLSTRRRAIERLQKRLLNGDPGGGVPSQELIQAAWDDVILRIVLRTLSDPVEKCRELGIQLIKSVVKVLPQVERTLSHVVPLIAERMGQVPVLEESEDIRLQLVQLVTAMLSAQYPADACEAVADPLVKFLVVGLADQFHEVKKGVCQAVVCVSQRSPRALEAKSEQLLKSLLLNVTHTHSRNKTAWTCVSDYEIDRTEFGKDWSVSSVLAPAVKPLALDRSLSVREAFFAAVARWLGYTDTSSAKKPNPARQEKDPTANLLHLLPLLLLGVTDESSGVAAASLHLVEEVGRVYDQYVSVRFASADKMMMDVDEEITLESSVEDETIGTKKDPAFPVHLLTSPYKGRPSAGCRRMLQDNLKELLKATTRDLREWKKLARIGAARLVHTLLVLAEDHVTDCLDTLLPALISAVSDDDVAVAQQVIGAAQVLGYYVRAEYWLPFILESLADSRSNDAMKANVLVVLSGLLFGTTKNSLPKASVLQLSIALSQPDVRCCDHPAVRCQLLAVLTNLLNVAETIPAPAALNLFLTLLQLQSVEEDAHVQQRASENVETLRRILGPASVNDLYLNFIKELMPVVTAGYEEWIGASPGRALFQTFMKNSGSTVGPYLPAVVNMFSVCLHHDRDPALRISFLQLLDELFENQELGPWWLPLSEQVIMGILIPCGVWRIGKVAAAIRNKAMVALGTFLRHNFCTQVLMLTLVKPEKQFLSVVTSCLDEDYYVDTRRATCHVMQHILRIAGTEMPDNQRNTISVEIQKRLDDSNDSVRLGIVPAIGTFFQTMPSSYTDEAVKSLLSTLLVHMDDTNPQIQGAVCVAAQASAIQMPQLVVDLATKICKEHRTTTYLDQITSLANTVLETSSSEPPAGS